MRYSNIQALRCAAALSVFICHLAHHSRHFLALDSRLVRTLSHPLLPNFGVLLFFVISGFVLTHCLRAASVPKFLGMRLLRLYPALWLATLLIVLLKLYLFPTCPPIGPG